MININNNLELSWNNITQSRGLIFAITTSILLLLAWAILAPRFFLFVQQRPGSTLEDPVLKLITAHDLSQFIFLLLYFLIAFSILVLAAKPFSFVIALQGYLILTLFRVISLFIIPLENPDGLINLVDPVVDSLFYQTLITKDLFFSGHTSVIFLFAFCVQNKAYRVLLFLGGIAIGIMLLIQHSHYFIDVAVAPIFSYLSYRISKYAFAVFENGK